MMNKLFCMTIPLLCAFAMFVSQILAADEISEGPSVSSIDIDFYNEAQQRATKVRFWYDLAAEACAARICLSDKHDVSRVALLSHGAFGGPQSMSWVAEPLAAAGWLVAGVAHFGESRIYGPETIDPSVVSRFWQRPQDISFALDRLTDANLFNANIENDAVLMLGFSSGGFTALALAGAQLEMEKTEEYCRSEEASTDKGCSYVSASAFQYMRASLDDIGRLQQSMADPRVSAVIAMDPALGHGASESSLGIIDIPTLIFGSVENDFLPYEVHAAYYAKHIPGSELVPVEQGAGHFVYVSQCDFNGEAMGVPICKDRDGVNRTVIQEQILSRVFEFLLERRTN